MSDNQKYKRKVSGFPSILSISMVLFLLGLLGILILTGRFLSDEIKENMNISCFFYDEASIDYLQTQKELLETFPEVKKVMYVSKEEAAKKYSKEIGADFIEVAGINPLLNCLDITLKSEYADLTNVKKIEEELKKDKYIHSVDYPKTTYKEIDNNLRTSKTVLLSISLLLIAVCVILINSTIRLHLFSKRFLVKSMQLVGATEWFIIKPIMSQFFKYAISGLLIASFLLGIFTYFGHKFQPDIIHIFKWEFYLVIFVALFIFAIIIVTVSSFLSTKRYLRLKIENLY